MSISHLCSIPLSLPQSVPPPPWTGGDSPWYSAALDRCRLQFQLLLSAEKQCLCCSAALKPLHQPGPKVNRAVRPSSRLLISLSPAWTIRKTVGGVNREHCAAQSCWHTLPHSSFSSLFFMLIFFFFRLLSCFSWNLQGAAL